MSTEAWAWALMVFCVSGVLALLIRGTIRLTLLMAWFAIVVIAVATVNRVKPMPFEVVIIALLFAVLGEVAREK